MSPADVTTLLAADWLLLVIVGTVAALITGLSVYLLAQSRVTRLREENSRLLALLESEQARHEDKLDAYDEARDQLIHVFSSLSGQALSNNNESFLRLARESLGQYHQQARSELALREHAIEAMVAPLRQALDRTQEQVRALERERHEAYGALRQHLQTMSRAEDDLLAQTRNLTQALRRPEVRGRWGELSLRRLVELAGMSAHCDFTEQVTAHTDAGPVRPDMLIHLPDDRDVVVDVKTPLDAYIDAVEAKDEDTRKKALARHARNVRERVRELSAKAYWEQFAKGPDFVVLFIPGEQFLSAAVEADRNLLEDALTYKIIVASPTSFVAIMRAIAFSWRQLAIIRNADRIRSIGEEFYQRLGVFTEHLAKLGRGLAGTVEHFNRTVGSLERQLMPSARRFSEMGIRARSEPTSPEPVETTVRKPQSVGPTSEAGQRSVHEPASSTDGDVPGARQSSEGEDTQTDTD